MKEMKKKETPDYWGEFLFIFLISFFGVLFLYHIFHRNTEKW